MLSTCSYKNCTALPDPQRAYCAVHDVEKLMARVRAIIENNMSLAVQRGRLDAAGIVKLADDILYDLDHTV